MEIQETNTNSNNNNNTLIGSVPNSTATLVLGILSIVFCWCYGIPGTVLGIIALVISKKGKLEYDANPTNFTKSSYSNMKAGRVCAIIGLSISSVYLIIFLIYFAIVGTAISTMPWQEMMENSSRY